VKIALIIMITIIPVAVLTAGSWQWAQGFGSQGMERSWDLAVDYGQSDIFVGGEFTDSLYINGVSYPSQGLSDGYLIKFNDSGQLQWVKTFGSIEEDVCLSIDVDDAGNCYFTGFYIGTLSMDGMQVSGEGMWDVFYGKVDPDGQLLWLKSFGGVLNDIGYGIAVTPSGEVYITGWFADTIDFGDGVSITSYGGSDIYLAKFDTNGNPLWARHAGSVGVEYGYKVDVSISGQVYVTGSASPGSSFDGVITDAAGMFVASYDPTGSIQWVLPSYNTGALNICADQYNLTNQQHAVIGRITGTGMIGDTVLTSVNGSDDIYIAWFSSGGAWTQVQHYGGPGSDKGRAGDIRNEQVFLSSFQDTVDFGGTPLSSAGDWDVAITNISSHLPISFGSVNSDVGSDIKLLSGGRFVVTGWFSGQMRLGNQLLDSGDPTNVDTFVAVYDRLASSTDDLANIPEPTLYCYPNPGVSSFTFESKHTGRIGIYNLRGQLVRSLEPLHSKAEFNIFHWDALDQQGRPCPAGIYIVQTPVSSSRILLLKP